VILDMTRYFWDTLFPRLQRAGVHRVHSLGPADDPGGRRWKEKCLGAKLEAILAGYGKDQEDFVLHVKML
jgi:hypothetical protein